jgi:hypothetical protein
MRLGIRARPQARRAKIPEFAPVLERVAGPGLSEDFLRFLKASLCLVGVDPVALIFVDVEEGAAAQAENQPSLAEMIEQG